MLDGARCPAHDPGMDDHDIDALLWPTLDDRRLSRGERSALRQVLTDLAPAAADLDRIRNRAFALVREALPAGPDGAAVEWIEEVVRLLDGLRPRGEASSLAEVCFSPGPDCLARITGLFGGARETVDVCVYTITDDRITRAMEEAHDRGVRLRVLSDVMKSTDRGSDIDRLARRGVAVAVDDSEKPMHHKFAIFDGAALATGSYNWTRGAAEYNEENLVVTDDPRLVDAFARRFARLWSRYR